jgi:hypothetical protein
MIALEIVVNGEAVVIAGVEDWGLLSAHITARRASENYEYDKYEMTVGGLAQQNEEGKHEHFRWGRKELRLGDRIAIKLIETNSAEPPIRRYRSDKAVQEHPFTEEEVLEMQRDTYLALKKKFEGTDVG